MILRALEVTSSRPLALKAAMAPKKKGFLAGFAGALGSIAGSVGEVVSSAGELLADADLRR